MMIFLNFSQSLGFSLSGSSDPLIFQQQFFGFPSWATGHTYDLSTDTSYQKFLDTTHPFNTVRYQPQDLAPIPSDFTFNAARKFQLREEAGIQFADMAWHFQHVFQGKKRLSLTSAYRSYAFQERLNKNCRANQCAEAGTSEHQA